MIHQFHNHHGFGDCFWHMNWLDRAKIPSILYCKEEHHADLKDLFPNAPVKLRPIQEHPNDSFNCWIGASLPFSWHASLCPRNLILFLCETWFEQLSRMAGVENPFKFVEDFLYQGYCKEPSNKTTLLIDCEPRSGQWSQMDMEGLKNLNAPRLHRIRHGEYSLRHIGLISTHSDIIAGVATGPLWPCLNTSNKGKKFVILLDQVELNYGPSLEIIHCKTVKELEAHLDL